MTMTLDQHFFFFFSFSVINFKCNLIFFDFEFVTRKQNNKNLITDLGAQNED